MRLEDTIEDQLSREVAELKEEVKQLSVALKLLDQLNGQRLAAMQAQIDELKVRICSD